MLQAPFPYFGGKSRVAAAVWGRFGDVPNYVEPFFGSGAVLLARPHDPQIETVNDKDGYVANFWRAVKSDPAQVAYYADWPVNENDLHARHAWLVGQRDSLTSQVEGDPEFYDAKVAGWWCWGVCCWIGRGFCSGRGPWHQVDGQLVHLGNAGPGVTRQLVHLGDVGRGVHRQPVGLYAWFEALADRLRYVRVCSGDWTRVMGPTPTVKNGLTAIFLDPPYGQTERDGNLYRIEDSVSTGVREWAIANGDNPLLRIALCGYEGEHKMPDSWDVYEWSARGGYGNQGETKARENRHRERIWFSKHCLKPDRSIQLVLPLPVEGGEQHGCAVSSALASHLQALRGRAGIPP